MEFNPSETHDPSEVVPLRKARRDFLQYKQQTQKESTARAYNYPTKSFIQFCEQHGIKVTGDVSKRTVATWTDKRREEVKQITVHNNAKHLRVFLKWMGNRELVEWGLHEKMEIPNLSEDDDVNEDVLRVDHAEGVLEYLDTYHYASTYHTLFYLMWHTGCRISGAIALDVDDFNPSAHQDNTLTIRNRKSEGSALKNGNGGERDVTISDGLSDVISDYLASRRTEKEDQYGREPLFTVPSGRLYRQRAYKNVVALTRPCVSGGSCPHNREIETCEAAQDKEQAPSCPSSLSLHPVRKGSITNHINEGWPKEALSERVDVSVDVLEKHYDFRTNEQKRQNRREFLHE